MNIAQQDFTKDKSLGVIGKPLADAIEKQFAGMRLRRGLGFFHLGWDGAMRAFVDGDETALNPNWLEIRGTQTREMYDAGFAAACDYLDKAMPK